MGAEKAIWSYFLTKTVVLDVDEQFYNIVWEKYSEYTRGDLEESK